jgi:hypothetical protein
MKKPGEPTSKTGRRLSIPTLALCVLLLAASQVSAQDVVWCHCRVQDQFELPLTGGGYAARRTFGTRPFRMEISACKARATYRRFAQHVEDLGYDFGYDVKGECIAFDTRGEAQHLVPANNPPYRGWTIDWDGR